MLKLKECMSILFACERFDQYLHGHNLVSVTTHHKPMVSIFTNYTWCTLALLLRLQKYRLQVNLLPGNKMYIADMLNWAYLTDIGKQKPTEHHIFQIATLQRNWIHQPNRLYQNQRCFTPASRKTHPKGQDTSSTTNKKFEGIASKEGRSASCICMYWGYRITVQNGALFNGPRVVVQRSLQAEMLIITYTSHQGAEASIRRVCEVIFWQGMTTRNQTASRPMSSL